MPRPKALCTLTTKNGCRFFDLPSSPWQSRGMHLSNLTKPALALSKTGCSEWFSSYLFQNSWKIEPSRAPSGRRSPAARCVQFWSASICNHVRTLMYGTRRSDSVFRKLTSNGIFSFNWLNKEWQFLSAFLLELPASFLRPPEASAAASPKSKITSCAVRAAAAQEALARRQRKQWGVHMPQKFMRTLSKCPCVWSIGSPKEATAPHTFFRACMYNPLRAVKHIHSFHSLFLGGWGVFERSINNVGGVATFCCL